MGRQNQQLARERCEAVMNEAIAEEDFDSSTLNELEIGNLLELIARESEELLQQGDFCLIAALIIQKWKALQGILQ